MIVLHNSRQNAEQRRIAREQYNCIACFIAPFAFHAFFLSPWHATTQHAHRLLHCWRG